MTGPLLFTFGVHFHQPVGNFDSVFEQHLADVYRPLLTALDEGGTWPITLHLSGPLLDWLEANAAPFVDQVGDHVAAGRIELLLAGYDEPILAVWSREDRLEQLGRMRETLRSRFGADATGLWLTERVWEPDLVVELVRAGVRYVVVDDRHFLVTGFERPALHRPFRTESAGSTLAVFPIDERLRYLVPFQPPAELATYFRELRAGGAPLAILADDGEKFGGWPGTREWVYQRGWMRDFTATLRGLAESGEVRLATFSEALATIPSGGLAYLPSASYREMEGWALPPDAALRLAGVEATLGAERIAGPDGGLVRGSHWRNFLARYPESNRIHKKAMALSALARQRGDPPEARRAIGRAQCNDGYWHGVFGGLYLPHLRHALWRQLAEAERILRSGESLVAEVVDFDRDGQDEIWVHSGAFSALVSPDRGGVIEEWTWFAAGRNLADTLTRRIEAYHRQALDRARAGEAHGPGDGAAASIHDLEQSLELAELPPFDRFDRAILQERIVDAEVTLERFSRMDFTPRRAWIRERAERRIESDGKGVTVDLRLAGLHKRIGFSPAGAVRVRFVWEVPRNAENAWFTTELSVNGPIDLDAEGAEIWRYPIETVAKSERGFDRTVQGSAIVLRWPADRGSAGFEVRPAE